MKIGKLQQFPGKSQSTFPTWAVYAIFFSNNNCLKKNDDAFVLLSLWKNVSCEWLVPFLEKSQIVYIAGLFKAVSIWRLIWLQIFLTRGQSRHSFKKQGSIFVVKR